VINIYIFFKSKLLYTKTWANFVPRTVVLKKVHLQVYFYYIDINILTT